MAEPKRYPPLLVALHWVIALAIFWMLASGAAMSYLDLGKSFKFNLYQWHKGSGVLVLVAVSLRVLVALVTLEDRPPLPAAFSKVDKVGAKAGHILLYVLMVLMPLSGWLLVSSSVYGLPTIVFDMFEWPHIPGITGNKLVHEVAETIHFVSAIALAVLILAHILAVVKHTIKDKINLLPRMFFGS